MALTLKNLTIKAIKKGIVVKQEDHVSILKSWKQESILFNKTIEKDQHSNQHSIEKDQHSNQHSIENFKSLSILNIPKEISPKAPDLTLKQLKILYWICLNQPFKIKGKEGVAILLNISYGTVRSSLQSLEKKGYIDKPKRFEDHRFGQSFCNILNVGKNKKIFENIPKRGSVAKILYRLNSVQNISYLC